MTAEPTKGRPRSERLHQVILKTAFNLVLEKGFRALSVAPTVIPTTKALIRKLNISASTG